MISTEKPGTPEELVHYGVKGMKWGVRKADRPSKQERREGRAQKFVQKSGDIQKQIDALKANPGRTALGKRRTERRIAELQKQKDRADLDAERKRQGKLSTNQRRVVIGTAVVGTLIAAGVTYKLVNSGEARQLMNKGKARITGKEFTFKRNPDLADPDLAPPLLKTVANGVNPGYGKIGTGQNCRRCTFAYELRRRGYDVAATRTPSGSGQNAVGLYNVLDTQGKDISLGKFRRVLIRDAATGVDSPAARQITELAKNVSSKTKIDAPGSRAIFRDLARQPNRSRGELAVTWVDGGGHSMAYEIVNGAVHILDTQTGRMFSSAEELAHGMPLVAKAGFTRLDNVDIDPNFIQRWVRNA